MLLYAVVFINVAFILYTLAVLAEKFQGELKPWHLLVFWLGLGNDAAGTLSMEEIVKQSTAVTGSGILYSEPLHASFHTMTGSIALVLMLFHTLWATTVLVKHNTTMMKKFHKLSFLVWLIWLIPFITGAIFHYGAGVSVFTK